MRCCVRSCLFALVAMGAMSAPQAFAQTYTVGGAVYTDLANPLTSGLPAVTVTVEGDGGTFEGTTAGPSGVWLASEVPEGTYTVTPTLGDWCFKHVQTGVVGPPPPINIMVDADHQAENLNMQFLASQDCCSETETRCCDDGQDNDGDGCTDAADSDCGGMETSCTDGQDNDCDGLADCLDSDCQPCCGDGNCDSGEDSCNCEADCGAPAAAEVQGQTCEDGLDNDCDYLIDCCDPDCEPCDGDPDGDGVIGYDDVCPCTPSPGGVNTSGRPLGDLDNDCDVDLEDYSIMGLNFTGPRMP